MSNRYTGFQDKMKGDMGQASIQAQGLEGTKATRKDTTRTRLRTSDMPSVAPAAAHIDFENVTFHKLRHGDVILCRIDRDVNLRRFLRFKLSNDGTTTLMVTRESSTPMIEMVPSNALIGRVVTVEYREKLVAVKKLNRGLTALKNKLTDFGTTSPGERLGASFDFVKSMVTMKKRR
jgi:hypothetical protein